MVIGTHSLYYEKIEFQNLKIAVIDEQHRFGVVQRGRFNSKVSLFFCVIFLFIRLHLFSLIHNFKLLPFMIIYFYM